MGNRFEIWQLWGNHFAAVFWEAAAGIALGSSFAEQIWTFGPELQIIGKHNISRFSYLFAYLYVLSSDFFSSTLLFSNLSLLSASVLLCFSSVHIVGSLASKCPSI